MKILSKYIKTRLGSLKWLNGNHAFSLHSISQEGGGLSSAAIAGIAVGAVAGVGGIAAVVVVLVLFVF